MSQVADKLSKTAGIAITVVGVLMLLSYFAYLPFPSGFEATGTDSIGLILYGLASAGAGFVAWGLMLANSDDSGISKQQIFKATGVGLGLLGLMRLGTAIFPHAPFDQIIYVPISEFIVFTLLAIKFYKA